MIDYKKPLGNQLERTIRLRHDITNVIGIPIVFVYFVYAVSGGWNAIWENARQMAVLGAISVILIGFAVFFHIRRNKIALKDVKRFLDKPERHEGESAEDFSARAKKVIMILLNFPYKSAVISLFTWPSTIFAIIVATYILVFRFPLNLMMVMVLGAVSGGILVAVFQFYLFKQGIHPFLKVILQSYPQYWREEKFFRVALGLRKKLLVSFVCLMWVMMTMMAVLIYFDVGKLIISQWGKTAQSNIKRQLETKGSSLINALTPEEKKAIIQNMIIGVEGANFYLSNGNGESLLPGVLSPAEKEILQKIANVKTKTKIGKDLTLMTAVPGMQDIALDLEASDFQINVWVRVPESDYTIVVRRSFKSFTPQLFRIIVVSIFVVLFGVVVSVIFTNISSQEVTKPIDELVEAVEKVSRGDLTHELHLMTYDEVGLLAVHIKKMIENLRGMMRQIGEASGRVEEATVSIVDGFKRVSEGSRSQSGAVDETGTSLDEMNASIKGIGENVETLASTAEESSASIMEMSATIEEVADNVENLAAAVEQTTSSISEMAASVRQVAENVESLSRKAENTVSSVTQMEASIKEVQTGAEETAQLTELVSLDAETGADKVQNTIAGISRARVESELAVRVIHELAQRAEEIGNILTVIDDVTDETNLLALNAAIIAAQAGEHGRGFAVVADEIKDLAERTAQSTQEIAQLIEAVQKGGRQAVDAVSRGFDAVEDGAKLSQEAGVALTKILESAQKSTQRTHDIARATVEQAKRTKEVLKFFEEISENIHQVEVATREQSKGADQIQKTSERMREIAKMVKKATQEQFLGSKQITQAMENINQIVSFINSSQREQITNTDQVVKAIQEIRSIAAQNEEGVEAMFQASANLSSLAEELRSMVEAFKLGIAKTRA